MKSINQSAYTLVELSISLSILALMLVGMLGVFIKKDEVKRYKVTIERMERIEKEIANFADKNLYLPCPSQGDTLETDVKFGNNSTITYNNTNNTSGSNCNLVNQSNATTNFVGMVPVRTLNLPDYYAYDGWDRKFSYSIATGMGSASDIASGDYKGDIRIIDLQGINKTQINHRLPNNYGAAYVLFSFGQNGLGAWRKNSNSAPTLPANNTREYENADYLTSNANRTFIQNDRNYLFGHIVSYKILPNLINFKYQRSPFKIPSSTCSSANAILNDPAQTYKNIPVSLPNGTLVKDQIYKTSKALKTLCSNQPIGSLNSASNCTFIPSSISNLQLWLDADDIDNNPNNPATADGTVISTNWLDKSGNSRNATRTAGSPTYRSSSPFQKGAVYFSGTDSFSVNLGFLVNSNYTFFAVYTASPFLNIGNKSSFIIYNTAATTADTGIQIGSQFITNNAWGHGWGHTSDNVALTVTEQPIISASVIHQPMPYMVMGLFDKDTPQRILNIRSSNGFASNMKFSGSANALTNSSSGAIASCGGLSATVCKTYTGHIAEILFYNRVLTVSEQKLIEGYLLRKWLSGEC
ncbi:MAG: type II secretion system protein [Alphaproteobacteria bacterium]